MNWTNSTPVSFESIDVTGGFWAQKIKMIREITADAVYDRFAESGRFAALQADWKEGQPKPHIFWESDVAKWIEGVAYLLSKQRDPRLEALVDEAVDLMEKYQQPDGYLNVYFTVVEPDAKFTRCTDHELYCAGHLMEAAVAYDRATGKRKLLTIMGRYADLIDRVFRVEHSARFDTPGHEEIELALFKMYRHTGDQRFLRLAGYFIDTRGHSQKDHTYEGRTLDYMQAHLPVREQATAEGHSVRALYLYCAMADLAWQNRDEGLFKACDTLFDNIVNKRMYITGGVGSTYRGEAFTYDYDLPEYTAYAETCASIALAFFARRMWLIRPDRKYADCAELAIYNTALSGISLSGIGFFYENPLAADPAAQAFHSSRPDGERLPILERPEVFDCSCCPPNIMRMIASIGDFMYSLDGDTVYAHCYINGDASLTLGGKTVTLRQTTAYPYEGAVEIAVTGGRVPALALRIPGWSEKPAITVNGKAVDCELADGYARVTGLSQGDVVRLELDLEVRLVRANPKVRDAAGRCAVTLGPLVYCAEGCDNPVPLRSVRIAENTPWRKEEREIGGTRLLCLSGKADAPAETEALYTAAKPDYREFDLKLIPYHAWANRGITAMTVWLLEKE